MTDPGRLFMFGAYGLKPSKEAVELFKSTGATGLLLLARNIDTPEQTRAFVEELEQRLGRPLLTAVDHEGGWVLRFRAGVTPFPGNAALGRARSPKLAYEVGRQMARELAPMGIRMNLAPVVDVETKDYNPGIGIRSFGADPKLAGALGAAFARGLQEHGVSACAKHFPGKGAAAVDAHVELPTIKLPRASFERTHLAPFAAAARAGVDAIMSSHVRFPAYDSVPATFSRKIVRGLLREKLGYDGLVVSDDLCMGAITKQWPVAEAAARCLDAGHDVLMIAHDVQGMRDAVDLLRQTGCDEAQAAQAAARIERLLTPRKADKPADSKAGLKLARAIAEKAVLPARKGALRLPVPDEPGTLVLFPDFEQVRERFSFENGPEGPLAAARALAPRSSFGLTPIEGADTAYLGPALARAERILFFCFEARRFPGQKAVLQRLAKDAAKRTATVLIRSSRDLDLCPKDMTVLDSAGYRVVSLEAALARCVKRKK